MDKHFSFMFLQLLILICISSCFYVNLVSYFYFFNVKLGLNENNTVNKLWGVEDWGPQVQSQRRKIPEIILE